MGRCLRLLTFLIAASVCVLQAEPVITFGHIGLGGLIGTESDGAGGLVIRGSNIAISTLIASDVAAHADEITEVRSGAGSLGRLNFVTGKILSVVADAVNHEYTITYQGGGSFEILGRLVGVPQVSTDRELITNGQFATGSFKIDDSPGLGYAVGFTGTGTDNKDPGLLSYFNVPNLPFTFSALTISGNLLGSVGSNGSFSSAVVATLISNTIAPVPEAGTFALMGVGLLVVSRFRRNRGEPQV